MDRVQRNLAAAIRTMRDACDDAERGARGEDEAHAIQDVLHSLSWGYANASSSIECAMSAREDALAMAAAALGAGHVEQGERTGAAPEAGE